MSNFCDGAGMTGHPEHEISNAQVLAEFEELRDLVEFHSRGHVGAHESTVPDLNTARLTCAGSTDHCLERPLVSIILQGNKQMTCGIKGSTRDYRLAPGNTVLIAVDMPTSSTFLDSTPEMPFLAIFIYLNKRTLLDLSLKMGENRKPDPFVDEEVESVVVDMVDPDFLSCMLRLARLWDKPEQIAIRAPIIMEELHYVVLNSRYGRLLQHLYRRDSQNSSVVQAVTLLKQDLAQPLRVDDLARQVNMSVSSLHRHFKQLTGYSPLQYRKQLRLLEARRLMFSENEQAARAAITVGYESITQFNREYKRMFGEPPHRDIRKLQAV